MLLKREVQRATWARVPSDLGCVRVGRPVPKLEPGNQRNATTKSHEEPVEIPLAFWCASEEDRGYCRRALFSTQHFFQRKDTLSDLGALRRMSFAG